MTNTMSCVICGSKNVTFACDVFCCIKCQDFFESTMQSSTIYVCSDDEKCEISCENEEENCCYCMFKKCLTSGMIYYDDQKPKLHIAATQGNTTTEALDNETTNCEVTSVGENAPSIKDPETVTSTTKKPRRKGRHLRNSEVLEEYFKQNQHPSFAQCQKLAMETGLSLIQVRAWFRRNRHQSTKKVNQGGLLNVSNFYTKRLHKTSQNTVKRGRFSACALEVLHKYLKHDKPQTQAAYCRIAAEIDYPPERVKRWFSCSSRKHSLLCEKQCTLCTKTPKAFNSGEKKNFKLSSKSLLILKGRFQKNSRPTAEEYQEMSKIINEPEYKIRRYFFNRRYVNKKQFSRLNSKLSQRAKDMLDDIFERDSDPTSADIEIIAQKVNQSPKVISDWFKCQRSCLNKTTEMKKRQQPSVVLHQKCSFRLSKEKKIFLSEFYKHTKKPTSDELKQLALQLGVMYCRVKLWFEKKNQEEKSGRSQQRAVNKVQRKQENVNDQKPLLLKLTPEIKKKLEVYYYKIDNSPSKSQVKILADQLQVKCQSVAVWFRHARRRHGITTESQDVHPKDIDEEDMSQSDQNYSDEEDMCQSDKNVPYKEPLLSKLTPEIKKKLEAYYNINKNMTKSEIRILADQLQIRSHAVFVWFRHARKRDRENTDNVSDEEDLISVSTQPEKKPLLSSLTPEIKRKLDSYFNRNKNPTKNETRALAAELQIKHNPVVTWFRHAKTRLKVSNRDKNESEHKEQTVSVNDNGSDEDDLICVSTPKVDHDDKVKDLKPDLPVPSSLSSTMTSDQQKKLQNMFELNRNPSLNDIEIYAKLLGTTFMEVAKWFENARKGVEKSTSMAAQHFTPQLPSPQTQIVRNVDVQPQGAFSSLGGPYISAGSVARMETPMGCGYSGMAPSNVQVPGYYSTVRYVQPNVVGNQAPIQGVYLMPQQTLNRTYNSMVPQQPYDSPQAAAAIPSSSYGVNYASHNVVGIPQSNVVNCIDLTEGQNVKNEMQGNAVVDLQGRIHL